MAPFPVIPFGVMLASTPGLTMVPILYAIHWMYYDRGQPPLTLNEGESEVGLDFGWKSMVVTTVILCMVLVYGAPWIFVAG